MDMSQLSRVNINLLVTLQSLLKERSASAAANSMNLSQSSISKNLAQLRHLFNDPLFHRGPHGLIPTQLSLEIEPKLNLALFALDNLFAPDEFNLKEHRAKLKLSMPESAFEFLLAPMMTQLITAAPYVQLDTWFKDTLSLDHLGKGLLDFVILPQDLGQTPKLGNHLNTQELYRDELICLVRKGHPVLTADKPNWDQETYLKCRHIHVRDNELGAPVFDQTLAQRGLERDIAIQVPDFNSASAICQHSDLIFTTSAHWGEHICKKYDLVSLPMPCATLPVVYSLIWHQRSESDPAHLWFKQALINAGVEQTKGGSQTQRACSN